MTLLDQLKLVAAVYGASQEMVPSTVSRRAFGDGNRLPALLSGKADLTTRRFERTLQWFSDNWPDGAVWPASVTRPTVVAA